MSRRGRAIRRADEALKRAREALYGNHSFVWAAQREVEALRAALAEAQTLIRLQEALAIIEKVKAGR